MTAIAYKQKVKTNIHRRDRIFLTKTLAIAILNSDKYNKGNCLASKIGEQKNRNIILECGSNHF